MYSEHMLLDLTGESVSNSFLCITWRADWVVVVLSLAVQSFVCHPAGTRAYESRTCSLGFCWDWNGLRQDEGAVGVWSQVIPLEYVLLGLGLLFGIWGFLSACGYVCTKLNLPRSRSHRASWTGRDPQGSFSPPPGCPQDPFLAWELTNLQTAQLWPSHGGNLQSDNHWKWSVSSAPSWAVPGTVCMVPWEWAEAWRDGCGSLAARAVTVRCPGTFPDLL